MNWSRVLQERAQSLTPNSVRSLRNTPLIKQVWVCIKKCHTHTHTHLLPLRVLLASFHKLSSLAPS